MPLFDTDSQETFQANGSGFQFSGINLSKLGASEYTLVGGAWDVSGSVTSFGQEIEACLINSLEACQRSPRVDNLLNRQLTFASAINELHGFRPLADCHLGNYKGCIQPGGATVLYDASVDLVDSLATYGKQLIDNDFLVNGIIVICTDGADYGSTLKAHHVAEAMKRATQSESLESLVSILIGINITEPAIAKYLEDFKNEVGFSQFIPTVDASPKTLAKLAKFIQASISSQSTAIGSGGPSKLLTF
jgi:hypothetical protein